MNSRDFPFAYRFSPLDRRAGARARAAGPDAPSSRVILLHGDRPVTGRFAAHELPETAPERVLLGLEAVGAALYAAAALGAVPEGLLDLRSLAVGALIPDEELSILAQARALLSWHERHRFCAQCGQKTESVDHGAKRKCAACGTEHFPRTDPVVILTVTDGERILLGRGLNFPPGMYSALAGFLEPGESIEQAARRELEEETGIVAGELAYLASQPWPFPSSLMIGLIGKAVTTQYLAAAKIAEVLERSPKCGVRALGPGEPVEGVTGYRATINGGKFAF